MGSHLKILNKLCKICCRWIYFVEFTVAISVCGLDVKSHVRVIMMSWPRFNSSVDKVSNKISVTDVIFLLRWNVQRNDEEAE